MSSRMMTINKKTTAKTTTKKFPNTPLPGIVKTDEVYQMVFAGAKREWANDEDGWQTVTYKRRPKRYRQKTQDLIEHIEETGFFSGQGRSYLD